jgi:hypothetical protein
VETSSIRAADENCKTKKNLSLFGIWGETKLGKRMIFGKPRQRGLQLLFGCTQSAQEFQQCGNAY